MRTNFRERHSAPLDVTMNIVFRRWKKYHRY